MIITNEIFANLPIATRQKIIELQRHILIQERFHRPEWPEANRLIKDIAREITSSTANEHLPINLESVVSRFNIRLKQQTNSFSEGLGKLKPISGGFELAIFGQMWKSKLEDPQLPFVGANHDKCSGTEIIRDLTYQGRLTLAHELGHILFYTADRISAKPTRLISKRLGETTRRWREEGLCEDFARALLMPDEYKYIIKEPGKIHDLFEISETFHVSFEPAVRRILYDWRKWPSGLIVNVDFKKTKCRIKCFRGIDRKKISSSNPTRTKISDLLGDVKTPSEAATMFRKVFGLDEDRTAFTKLSLWVML
jgi:Zn-dependent peptidase ImmA (M78 family)